MCVVLCMSVCVCACVLLVSACTEVLEGGSSEHPGPGCGFQMLPSIERSRAPWRRSGSWPEIRG